MNEVSHGLPVHMNLLQNQLPPPSQSCYFRVFYGVENNLIELTVDEIMVIVDFGLYLNSLRTQHIAHEWSISLSILPMTTRQNIMYLKTENTCITVPRKYLPDFAHGFRKMIRIFKRKIIVPQTFCFPLIKLTLNSSFYTF